MDTRYALAISARTTLLTPHGYKHESVCDRAKEYVGGDVYVNNGECGAGILRYWPARHRCANKYCPELCARMCQFLYSRLEQDGSSKFCSVLSVICT